MKVQDVMFKYFDLRNMNEKRSELRVKTSDEEIIKFLDELEDVLADYESMLMDLPIKDK